MPPTINGPMLPPPTFTQCMSPSFTRFGIRTQIKLGEREERYHASIIFISCENIRCQFHSRVYFIRARAMLEPVRTPVNGNETEAETLKNIQPAYLPTYRRLLFLYPLFRFFRFFLRRSISASVCIQGIED